MLRYAEILGEGLNRRARAILHLALGFPSWRALVSEGGLSEQEAAAVMARAMTCCGV